MESLEDDAEVVPDGKEIDEIVLTNNMLACQCWQFSPSEGGWLCLIEMHDSILLRQLHHGSPSAVRFPNDLLVVLESLYVHRIVGRQRDS